MATQPSPGLHDPRAATPVAASPDVPNAADRAELTRELEAYGEGLTGRFSVSVRDLATGFTFGYGPGLRTATASIVKVDILVTLLLRTQREHRELTAAERGLAHRMITRSDNEAADALWSSIGSGTGLAEANRLLGLRGTTPAPGYHWGTTTTSAADQVTLLRALISPDSALSERHRAYVLGLMGDVVPDQAWGVSAGATDGAGVAVKNGWMPRTADQGRWTVNSIGRIKGGGHDLLVAVISDRHPTMDAGVAAVEHVARRVTGALREAS